MRVKTKKGRFALRPASLDGFQQLYVDVFSVAAALSHPEELFRSAAERGAVLVLDAWHESHLPLARRYLELCGKYGADCRLSESKPAEQYAVELCEAECEGKCAVVTRDYDAVVKAAAIGARKCAVLLFQRGRLWLAERLS